jgi:hypothetical protein
MAQPSQQEIISYIRQVAAQYGIDPNVMLRIIKQESGFNPAARGDAGHSVGLAQLFDKGLQQDFRQQMGVDPADPANWKQQIEFMARHASQTKGKIGGWNPWHGARDVGIAQYEGLPGGTAAAATGRKGMTGEVAQSATPMTPPPFAQPGDPYYGPTPDSGGQANMMDFFKQWQEANKPQHTLAGLVFDKLGITTPGDPNRPKTVAGAVFDGFKKQPTKLEQQVADLNPYAPMSDAEQLKKMQAPKTQTVAGALLGRKPAPAPAPTQQGPTLMSMLGQAKKADAAAAAANGVAPTPLATLFRMFV